MFENYNITIFNRKGILYIQFYLDGKQKQRSTRLKDTPANRKLIQKEVIPKLYLKLKNGELSKTKPQKFEWYAERYLRQKESVKTYQEIYNIVINQLYPIFKGFTIDKITKGMVKKWADDRLLQVSSNRVKWLLNVLGAILDIGMDYEHIDKNPARNIKLPKHKPTREMQPFTKEEVRILLDNAEGWFKNFLAVCFYTGMRHGEILALRWNDINFNNMTINITKAKRHGRINTPKTENSIRTIPVFEPLVPYLKEQQKLAFKIKSMSVFFNPRTKKEFFGIKTIHPVWYKLLKKTGLKKRVIYNTRHTFAINTIQAGVNIAYVSKILGHKNIKETLETYAKLLPEEHLKLTRQIDPFTDSLTDTDIKKA